MDFNQIAIFVKVVQAGSFSAAARLLDIPVSTVSHRVAMLEKRLGVTLLQRTTRQLHLTEDGLHYFENASKGLTHFANAEAQISETIEEPGGILRVSAPFDIGNEFLSSIVHDMEKAFPKVTLEFLLVKNYVDLVVEGIDVAIRTGELDDSTLIATNLGTAKWEVFSSPQYLQKNQPVSTPGDLSQHTCIPFSAFGKESWRLKNANTTITVPVNAFVMANDINFIKMMILEGKGIGILPSYQCHDLCRTGNLVRVLPDWYAANDPINVVYPRQKYISKKLRAFINITKLNSEKFFDPNAGE